MNIIHRYGDRVLLSLTSDEVDTIKEALAQDTSSDAAQGCLARLIADAAALAESEESDLLEAWVDGASVQVRVISAFGDPVDMSSEEAQDLGQRILKCASEAD